MSMMAEHAAPQRQLLFERKATDVLEEEEGFGMEKAEKPQVKRVAQKSEMVRPCGHNKWTKQTKKRGKLVLRCLECSVMWKTYPEFHTKCQDFHAGSCPKGDLCEHPHVYARRETKKKDPEPSDVIIPVSKMHPPHETNPPAQPAPPVEEPASDPCPTPYSYPASYYSAYESTSGYFPDYTPAPNSAAPAPSTSFFPTYYAAYEGGVGSYCQPDYYQPVPEVAEPVKPRAEQVCSEG
eukprot:TRINITY_DN7205_c1_g1_i1.p1 TRINITY_DN7205_c1_g1~~TRINITY_DN7205_c1_g1_i1.p1  ORF type:complete len:237 (+),score=59.43 TRINITY_DN7205_c1_g1_i1:126-836(+)